MHDIVRDYTIAQLGEADLRERQAQTTRALLAAKPEGGFPTAEHSSPSTLEGYVARQLSHRMRWALAMGEVPPNEWIEHEDVAVLRSVSAAVGYDAWVELIDAEAAAGELQRAARYAHVAAKLGEEGHVSGDVWNDLLHRAVDLSEMVPKDERDESFENEVLTAAFMRDFGNEWQMKVAKRFSDRAKERSATFDSKIGEAMGHIMDGCALSGVFAPLGIHPDRGEWPNPSWAIADS